MTETMPEPDFASPWGATRLHPIMAWRLWSAGLERIEMCESEPDDAKRLMLPPVALIDAERSWWWNTMVYRLHCVVGRLARGEEPLSMCVADDIILTDLIDTATERFDLGQESEMPESIADWVLSNPSKGEAFDFDYAALVTTNDADIHSLWHSKWLMPENADRVSMGDLSPDKWFEQ